MSEGGIVQGELSVSRVCGVGQWHTLHRYILQCISHCHRLSETSTACYEYLSSPNPPLPLPKPLTSYHFRFPKVLCWHAHPGSPTVDVFRQCWRAGRELLCDCCTETKWVLYASSQADQIFLVMWRFCFLMNDRFQYFFLGGGIADLFHRAPVCVVVISCHTVFFVSSLVGCMVSQLTLFKPLLSSEYRLR